MPYVPGLRSSYALTAGLVHFGRMLDKIRLHAANRLPSDYHGNLGIGFDGRTCAFLGVAYADLKARTVEGGTNEEILAWCESKAGTRSASDREVWSRFLMKIGWRDERSPILRKRVIELGLGAHPIETFFDLNDFDEGRDPVTRRAWEQAPARAIVVMGVSGSGKTTIGLALARELGWRFVDADDFHSATNVAKMRAGTPIDDADREPWLARLRAEIDCGLQTNESLVVACSALKERYRTALTGDPDRVTFVHLDGDRAVLESRLKERGGHFMNPVLLDSQRADLEVPASALRCDITQTLHDIIAQIRSALTL